MTFSSGRLRDASKRITSAAIASRTWSFGLLFGILSISAFAADQPSHTPPPVACEVRYYFREYLRGAKMGAKSYSAPSYEREALPLSQVTVPDGSVSRIVDGRVAHLPYRFVVKLTRNSDADQGTLEVNVLDVSGKPLRGFPQVITNPLTKTGGSSSKDYPIPVTKALTKKIEKTLLAKDQFLTYVALVIRMRGDVP
jgi:hypothetical protein